MTGKDPAVARNPAMKKATKAAKRKVIVAAKRKIEVATNSRGGRIRQAARQPILECLISAGLFENGMGTITLVRGVSPEQQHIAIFMLDTFCLGVKDTHFRTADREEAEFILATQDAADAGGRAAPEEARKLLRDAAAWAEGNGFTQPREFTELERLFGDVVPAETDYVSRMGHDGRVFYIPGPSESASEVRRRMRFVRERFGEAAIGSIFEVSDLDDPDWDDPDLDDPDLDDPDLDDAGALDGGYEIEGELVAGDDEPLAIA